MKFRAAFIVAPLVLNKESPFKEWSAALQMQPEYSGLFPRRYFCTYEAHTLNFITTGTPSGVYQRLFDGN